MARSYASGDLISFADSSAWNLNVATIGGWAKTSQTPTNGAAFVSRHNSSSSTGGFSMFLDSGGKLWLQVKPNPGSATDVTGAVTSLNNGAWHHLAAVWQQTSGNTNRLYVDGSADGTTNTVESWSFDANPMRFGNASDTWWEDWEGSIAHFAIWSVELSTAELAALARGANPLRIRPGNIVDYWPFDAMGTQERSLTSPRTGTLTGTAAAASPWVAPAFGASRSPYAVAAATGQPLVKRMGGVPHSRGDFGYGPTRRW